VTERNYDEDTCVAQAHGEKIDVLFSEVWWVRGGFLKVNARLLIYIQTVTDTIAAG
jgi:hypothetical protein